MHYPGLSLLHLSVFVGVRKSTGHVVTVLLVNTVLRAVPCEAELEKVSTKILMLCCYQQSMLQVPEGFQGDVCVYLPQYNPQALIILRTARFTKSLNRQRNRPKPYTPKPTRPKPRP